MEKILSQKVTVINEFGIHVRPAAMISKIALNAEKIVWIGYDHDMIDASSIIDILSIGCKKGDQILIKVEAKKIFIYFNQYKNLYSRDLEKT